MSDTIHFDGMPHLSVAEAAARAGLSVSYIRGLLRRGEMKSRGAGEKKYVDERSLSTFLVEREYKREMKRQELSRKRTEEYTQRFSVVAPSPPAREVRSTRIDERPVMDWGSLRASLLERTIALTLAIMMTIGTYAFVDRQSARHNLGLMQEGLQDVVDTLASVAETSKMITMDPSRSLAAAASFIPESLANFAKAFNTQINSLVYGAAFPENAPDSGASAAVEIQPYARATSQQPTPDDQQPPLATSASTPTTTIINNPVIERTIERVVETRTVAAAGGLTEEYLADKLGQLDNKLSSQIFALSSANSTAITQTYSVVAQTNKIDQLTNTDISSPRISGGTLTNAEISGGTISGASISGGAVSATTLSAGETTISGSLTLGENLNFSSSSSTFSSLLASTTNLLATSATSTYLFATAATSTSFFATVASSTNLYSQSASLGSLALSGLGTFASGFLSLASTTIGNGSEDGGLTIFGGATTTGNAYFAGGLGVGIATTTAGAFQTAGNAHIGGNLLVAGDSTVLGASSADTLSIQSSINSDLIPNQNITYDLGSASFFWENIYVGTVVANNLSAASSTIAGTSAATFTINSDNVSSDAEDADLIFFRGNVVPNALISWKSGTQRFEFNQATYISNLSGSTTQPTLRLQGVAGQTGNLFEIASSTGTTMFSVDASGATLGNGFLSQASSTVVGDFTATGNATFGGTFSTGTTSLNNLSVTNTSTSTFVGGVSLATLAASGAATLGSTLSVAGDTTLASATSTTFFATTASSTNLYAQTTSFGALALPSFAQNRVPYFGAAGAITSGSDLTYDGTTLTAGNLTSSGAVSLGFATSTTFFATTASSTNLFAQTASLGALSVLGTTVHSGATTLSSALTYGGVTLANAVTGTGSMVLSSSPTLTGTMLASAATLSSTLTMGGSAANIALGSNWLSGDGGDEGVFVDASGNVGIGTTTPASKLTVANTSSQLYLNDSNATDSTTLGGTLFSTNDGIFTMQGANSAGSGSAFRLVLNQVTGAVGLGGSISDASTLAGSSLTIASGGNVGIGTTSPLAKLHIANGNAGIASTAAGEELWIETSSTANTALVSPDAFTAYYGLGSPSDSTGAEVRWDFTNKVMKVGPTVNTADGQLALLYGNGSEALRVNASGNVGIGTASPQSRLDVYSSDTDTSVTGGLTITQAGAGDSQLQFSLPGVARWMVGIDNSDGDKFKIAGASGVTDLGTNTRLTIDSSGNVGIGTTTPNALLHVSNSVTSGTTKMFGNFYGSTNAGTFADLNGSTRSKATVVIGNTWTTSSGSVLNVYTGNTDGALFVSGSGNVGIGNTSPDSPLTFADAVGEKINLAQFDADNMQGFAVSSGQLNYHVESASVDHVFYAGGDNGDGTELLRIEGTGNVGIGTTSPAANLEIVGTTYVSGTSGTSTPQLSVNPYGLISGSSALGFNGGRGKIGYDGLRGVFMSDGGSTKNIVFDTANVERMRITTTGLVGIGTTSPWRTLGVTGTVGFDGLTGSTGAGSLCLSSSKQVVYNSGSDSCLSSTRATKRDIVEIGVSGSTIINALQPVSFIYNNDASSTVRYGFIAEDAAAVDTHLATYDAQGAISGIDDRSIISILVKALKELLAQVQALASVVAGFADSFTTNRLCVGSTCITETELKALLEERSISAPGADSSSTDSSESGDTATSTPDTIAPVVTINGANPAHLQIGDTYSDLGAAVADNVDQNLGYQVSLGGATSTDPSALVLDTSTSTTHIITYSATDQAGNEGLTTRTVIVGE